MYYKLGQVCVINWSSFVLLKIGANVVTNWGCSGITNCGKCYYKLEQLLQLGESLLQNGAAITNMGKIYYKLGKVLQIAQQQFSQYMFYAVH